MLSYSVVCLSVCVCVSACVHAFVLVTIVSPAKTTEPIEMPFMVLAHVGRRNHRENTIERSVLGGSAGYRYHFIQ